jgi:aspartate/methionine/tyrosine aminotransferase
MLEVCSTTLPQAVLPQVMSDSRYYPYLESRVEAYAKRSKRAVEVLTQIPGLILHEAQGAFYMSALFEEGKLTNTQELPISTEAESIITPRLKHASLDQRFVYFLLASTGICVVPLSTGFNSTHHGFRFTLLESDEQAFEKVLSTLANAIKAYIAS